MVAEEANVNFPQPVVSGSLMHNEHVGQSTRQRKQRSPAATGKRLDFEGKLRACPFSLDGTLACSDKFLDPATAPRSDQLLFIERIENGGRGAMRIEI